VKNWQILLIAGAVYVLGGVGIAVGLSSLGASPGALVIPIILFAWPILWFLGRLR